MKKTLLLLMTLFTVVIGYSQTFTDANFIEYTVIPNTTNVEATGYDFANGGVAVDIPSTVINNTTTYTVTQIGYDAFKGNATSGAQISSVIIPSSITIIGYGAFRYNLLSSVTIPDSVTQIGGLSFIDNQLTSVVLSNNLVTIPIGAFQSNALASINIPNSVTSIEGNAFFNNQLTAITIPDNVALIGQRSFASNPITAVTCLGATPSSLVTAPISNPTTDSISYNRSAVDLIIPPGTTSTYLGAGWTGFSTVNEDPALSTLDFELANNIRMITNSDAIKIVSTPKTKLKSYNLYSITGNKIKKGTSSTIDINSLSNGIYIIELIFNNGRLVKKFAK
jgi:hypothetical protein